MASEQKRPETLARRLSGRLGKARGTESAWRRETFVLPREEARAVARKWFDRFPKAAYATEVEFWRETPDGRIEFTMRRLPSAD